MFFDRELIFMKRILEKTNINLFVVDYDAQIKNNIKNTFQGLLDYVDDNYCLCDFFPNLKERTLYKVSDVLNCHYIFIKLPKTEKDRILIVGPFLKQELYRTEILEKGEQLHLNAAVLKQLEYFYASVPVLRDDGQFFALINTFCEQLWGSTDSYTAIDLNHDDASTLFNYKQVKVVVSEAENNWKIDLMEKRYAYEEQLLRAVSRGQIHKAEQMLSSFSSLAFESRSNDDLRNYKNYSIIMNTLLRKAAQDGGVHPIHLDKVSSEFAKKIELISSINSIKEIMAQMLNDYCRLVRKHSIKQYSPLVQRAIIKIENDLTADLSLKQLSSLNNVSTSYFSSLFKNETGQTLTDYVNNQRINQAKHLLRTTNLQVQTVAQLCGILDLHYFSKLFKRYVGKTPKEYREIKTVI
ncbi:MAG: AraC family transcriptional regulator [Clostridia bacterium]|nr:AraC family transcriptional regulator [Clostridia bacterium]